MTKLPAAGESLCNPFGATSQRHRRRVAVAECKWALKQIFAYIYLSLVIMLTVNTVKSVVSREGLTIQANKQFYNLPFLTKHALLSEIC